MIFGMNGFRMSLMGDESSGDTGGASDGDTGSAGGAAAEGSAGGNAGGDSGDGGSQGPVNFPAGLDEAISRDPSLKVFVNDQNEFNVGNLVKSYVHAQKMMGADKVVLPGDNATDEDINAFYDKLGRPALDKYEINANLEEGQELDQEMFDAFKSEAHKAGILPKQAQALSDWFNKTTIDAQKASGTQMQEAFDKSVNDLKTEWGEAFDKEKSLANSALAEFVDGDLMKEFKDAGLDDNVTVLKIFNKIGKSLNQEDTFSKESHGSFGMTPAEAQGKVNAYMADFNGPYMNADHVNHNQVVKEVEKLNQIIYKDQ